MENLAQNRNLISENEPHYFNALHVERGSEYNFEKVHFEPKYIVRSALLVSNFMQKIKKIWLVVQKTFLKKAILGPQFDLLTSAGPGQEFP